MLTTNKTMTINGTSTIVKPTGEEVAVANMSASFDSEGRISNNSNIYNKDVYESHKTEVLDDINEFNAIVYQTKNENSENIFDEQ